MANLWINELAKPYFDSFSGIWSEVKCLAKLSRSLLLKALHSLQFSAFTWGESITFQQQYSRHFHFYWTKKHFISEWYFPKNHKTESLVVRKDKKIVSLDQLESRRAIADLFVMFTRCLSPGRVKKLQKFINFCLKVGHSANLKRSKST